MWRDEENLEIGVDISDIPAVKIIFDCYGDSETEEEGCEGVFPNEDWEETRRRRFLPKHEVVMVNYIYL